MLNFCQLNYGNGTVDVIVQVGEGSEDGFRCRIVVLGVDVPHPAQFCQNSNQASRSGILKIPVSPQKFPEQCPEQVDDPFAVSNGVCFVAIQLKPIQKFAGGASGKVNPIISYVFRVVFTGVWGVRRQDQNLSGRQKKRLSVCGDGNRSFDAVLQIKIPSSFRNIRHVGKGHFVQSGAVDNEGTISAFVIVGALVRYIKVQNPVIRLLFRFGTPPSFVKKKSQKYIDFSVIVVYNKSVFVSRDFVDFFRIFNKTRGNNL